MTLFAVTFWGWIGIVALVVVAIALLNPLALRRIRDTLSAWIGKGAKAVWSQDIVAVHQKALDQKAALMRKSNDSLAAPLAEIRRTEGRIETNTQQANELEALAEQYVREGNDAKAREKLVEKAEIDKSIADDLAALKQMKAAYERDDAEFRQNVKDLAQAKREAHRKGIQLDTAKARAEFGSVMRNGFGLDDLADTSEEMDKQIAMYQAKADRSQAMDQDRLDDLAAKQRMRTSSADQALAALKQKLRDSMAPPVS